MRKIHINCFHTVLSACAGFMLVTGLTACGSVSGLHQVSVLPALKDGHVLEIVPRWYRQPQGEVDPRAPRLQPLVKNNLVFFARTGGILMALQADNGRKKWKVTVPPADDSMEKEVRFSGPLGEGGGLLLAGTHDGEVIALDINSGRLKWRSQVSSEVLVPPVFVDGVVAARANDGKIFGLRASDGYRLWIYESRVPALSLRGSSALAVDDGKVFAGQPDGKLVALNADSGELAWDTTIVISKGRSELARLVDVDADPVIRDGIIYTSAYQGKLAAVSVISGRVLWSRDISTHKSLAVKNDLLFVCDDESVLMALNRHNGEVQWRQEKLAQRRLTAPVMQNEHIVVADGAGYLHWVSQERGNIDAQYRTSEEAILTSPVQDRGRLYVSSAAGALEVLEVKTIK